MPAPERLGKYLIRRRLGAGAMGVVYEGFDPLIERSVALKVIRQETFDNTQAQELRTRLKREAQAAGRLQHPGIVAVFEYGEGEAGAEAFIAMEMVHGRELKAAIDAGERFSTDAVARMLRGVLAALQHAHERGVVHRDIKPGNVFLLPDGNVKVADFGIARIEASDLTQTGAVIGTPSYMAPEQLLGQAVDGRADLFACGVLLYQLLTGERPFTGSIATVMQKVLNEDPAPPSAHRAELAPHWDAVVRRALAKLPADRWQSAAEFAAAIEQAASLRPLAAPARPVDEEKTVILPRKAPTSTTTPTHPPVAPAPGLPPAPPPTGGFVQQEVPRTVPMPRTPGAGGTGATRGSAGGGATAPGPLDSAPPPPYTVPPTVVMPKVPPAAPAPRPLPPPPPLPPPRPPAAPPTLPPPLPPAAAAPAPRPVPVVPRTVPHAQPPAADPGSRKSVVAAAAGTVAVVALAGATAWWATTRGPAPIPELPPAAEPAASAPGAVPAVSAAASAPVLAATPPSPTPVASAPVAVAAPPPAPATPAAPRATPTPSPSPTPVTRPAATPAPAAAPSPSPAARPAPAPPDPWVAARERLDAAPASTGLAGALRLLLDVQDAKGRQTLADFERFTNALPEHSALAFGVRDGQLRMRWQFRAGSGAAASEMALRRCAEVAGRACALVSVDTDFRKPALLEMARQFGMADVASVRTAFVQTVASGLPGWRESLAAPAAPAPAASTPAPYATAPSAAPSAAPPPAPAPAARPGSDWAGSQARLRAGEAPRALGGALAVMLQAQEGDEVDILNRFDSALRRLRYSSALALGERGGSIVFGYAHGESRANWAEERAVAACSGIGAQGCSVVWVNGSTKAAELAALAARLETHPQSSVRQRFVELLRTRLSKGL